MKTTNRLISLFAAMCISATLMADVVYEPLIVKEGFNRDVIAECYPFDSTKAVSPLYAIHTNKYGITSCFATESVIDTVNKLYNKSHPSDKFTDNDLIISKSCGWPDDYHTTIRCIEDAKDYYSDPDVIFQLAAYDGPNALCLRPNTDSDESDGYGNKRYGTLRFKKIGCYDKLFFLVVSLRKGGVTNRRVNTTIYYSDGSTTPTQFTFENGLGGKEHQNVHLTNIYESRFKKNTSKDSGKAYASVFDVEVPQSKLIDSIVFENPVPNSAVVILAVTGRTADIAAPDDELTEVNEIGEDSFEACWAAIDDAVSYRLDVATDPDFQNILAEYNNKVIEGTSTCQEVVDLVTNYDYYWRVRSVNSDGGQSASSAARRVVLTGTTPPATNEESEDIESMLEEYAGYRAVVPTIQIHRTLYRDGFFNTLCLPFNMNAEEIANSPLVGMKVYEYVHADKLDDGLNIEINGPIDHIDAGVPYLVQWAPTTPEIIDGKDLIFHNVNIVTSKGRTIGEEDEVRFVGNIGIADMQERDENNLFLGANNTLYWPDGQTQLKGFRAYFLIPTNGPKAVARNTPARIVTNTQVTTSVEFLQTTDQNIQKIIRNGQIFILRDGRCYDLLGNIAFPKR